MLRQGIYFFFFLFFLLAKAWSERWIEQAKNGEQWSIEIEGEGIEWGDATHWAADVDRGVPKDNSNNINNTNARVGY